MEENNHATALASLNDELNGAYLYDKLAQVEKDARLAEVYRRMSAVEGKHAAEWVERLKADGVSIPEYKPSWRSRTLAWPSWKAGIGREAETPCGQRSWEPMMV
jgi:rubrerythrin